MRTRLSRRPNPPLTLIKLRADQLPPHAYRTLIDHRPQFDPVRHDTCRDYATNLVVSPKAPTPSPGAVLMDATIPDRNEWHALAWEVRPAG